MDKLTIYKNKGEVFNCQFQVDGASTDETVVRLCLEFENNKNIFFYGEIDEDGDCTIEIPSLKELENQSGKLVVEAIVDSIYFKLYEAKVELKNSVEITMKQPTSQQTEKKVKLESMSRESQISEIKPKKMPIKEQKNDPDGWQPIRTPKPKPEPAKSSGLKDFKSFREEKCKLTG